jgi:cytoskeleton protein RodZ
MQHFRPGDGLLDASTTRGDDARMPLDTSPIAETAETASAREAVSAPGATLAGLHPIKLVLDPTGDIGSALRNARETLGLPVEDVAAATRVRAAYITAIEAFDLERLPARPFVVGYVRAYARALGLEPEAVVTRFRAEAPGTTVDLGAPAGIFDRGSRPLGGLAAAAAMIVAALGVWNVLRHAEAAPHAAPPSAPTAVRLPASPLDGPAHLGAPLPPPPEAATPAAYETPGLAQSTTAPDEGPPAGTPFAASGTIYGAADTGIILQARKPTTLVVRSADGAVRFARQLAAGEAWRAPATPGLVVDVGNPASIEVYLGGLARSPLTASLTSVSSLAG